jgi:imidazolonepropionase-like amidohydrolase
MKTRILLVVLIAVLCSAAAIAQSQPEPPPSATIVVKAGRLLDVRKGSYVESAAVWIEGERIREAGAASAIQEHAPKDAKVIDLGNATVLPGLIDCHTHIMAFRRGGMVTS